MNTTYKNPLLIPVAQFLRQVDVQDVGEDVGELGGVAQSSADGVGWVNVIQL